jgi:nitronate monooxygenase
VYQERSRVCDLGFLREAYRTPAGKLDFRCPGEPLATYVAKGGAPEHTSGRKCLCNALVANIGHPQVRQAGYVERGLVTSGDDLVNITDFLPPSASAYTAADVLQRLLAAVPAQTTELLQMT